MRRPRFIISGGGSGGHIFPAIAIANALKEEFPEGEILFVGAEGKMEMEKVPKAGYRIKGLKIVGLQRSLTWKNVLFPYKLIVSLRQAQKIIREFNPDIVIGVGGYASGPTVAMASFMGIPTLIQEQNSFAGLTNRWLAKKVNRICVAYEGMENVFEKSKLVLTGNPVRQDILELPAAEKAYLHFNLSTDKKTILIFGGSLGSRTLNQAMKENRAVIERSGVQFLWQIGSFYREEYFTCETAQLSNVVAMEFIDQMELAYHCADLVICRAGALTIAEISVLGKASILVPSPNVSEDHQTHNAKALLSRDAAMMVSDNQASSDLINIALEVVHDQSKIELLSRNILKLGKPTATQEIVKEIEKLISNK
ncbi:MAG: undecaprenyldiphospho-muramoylpentapeptide beta-N-acetylglucosaminyltransferase [Saprospiraceae bacterium]|nr:undecaprenyldiphospho-muramoylpentapeptide beta-N-acetylglucosaminyltransferase [Saprospiraceae bacterium]